MKKAGIGYGSINHPVDRDPVCGYVGVINDTCPRCGRHEGEEISEEKWKELQKHKYSVDSSIAVDEEFLNNLYC
jgi:ribonucleoside-triphosphate reductase